MRRKPNLACPHDRSVAFSPTVHGARLTGWQVARRIGSRGFASALLTLGVLLAGCASLPPQGARPPSAPIGDTGDTRLGRALAARVASHGELSGFRVLSVGTEAFAARMALAAAAERSLDVQYYIWRDDDAGMLLLEALVRAADRGVRVRLLLDDAGTVGMDTTLAALAAHPNLEVRLYNPFAARRWRLLNLLGDFARLNRRMHNKSFTADNQVTIAGGRNVADEYFLAGDGVAFVDVDVAAIGPVVTDVSRSFERYWDSASSYPVTQLIGPPDPGSRAALDARFEGMRSAPQSVSYLRSVADTRLVADLLEGAVSFDWAHADVVVDDPAKTLEADPADHLVLFPELVRTIGRPERSLDMVSPYFVPGERGTEALVALARRGVRVRILTNSLAASDVMAVHAGYAPRRLDLARAGIALYEAKPDAGARAARKEEPETSTGSSGAQSLHAKVYAVDERRIFVGSFNFDQRSAHLNTELGLVIDSPAIAAQLAGAFDEVVPRIAWRVRIAPDGSLQWVDRTPTGEEVVHAAEPGASAWRLLGVGLLQLLPIEWLL